MTDSRRPRGFTLMELLIVVAVIAILIAFLVPALWKSKANSVKAVCLSNLRQTYLSVNAYATSFAGVTPVGAWGYKQHNYIVFFPKTGQAAEPSAYGLMQSSGLLYAPKAFFCPSYTWNRNGPSVAYDDIEGTNPWRSNPLPNPDPYPTMRTRLGYGMRPVANWVPYLATANEPYPSLVGRYLPVTVWINNPAKTTCTQGDVNINPATGKNNVYWPKLQDHANKAILSDITPHYEGLYSRHKEGANVLFGHGGAAWVPFSAFKANLIGSSGQPSTSEQDMNTAFTVPANSYMLDESVTPARGVWADFDQYQQ